MNWWPTRFAAGWRVTGRTSDDRRMSATVASRRRDTGSYYYCLLLISTGSRWGRFYAVKLSSLRRAFIKIRSDDVRFPPECD